MGRRTFPGVVATLAALLAAAAAVYAYDSSRRDVIAPGTRAAGVAISGMDFGQARLALERHFAPRLERSVLVRFRHRRFELSAAAARVRFDAGSVVAEALARSAKATFSAGPRVI
jgi:hypothetical protein